MVQGSNLMAAAREIGIFSFVAFMAYFTAIILTIIVGYLEEKVIPQLGLAANGTAVTSIGNYITSFNVALIAITAIITIVTGLLTLNVVLTAFGVKFNFKMGMGGRV